MDCSYYRSSTMLSFRLLAALAALLLLLLSWHVNEELYQPISSSSIDMAHFLFMMSVSLKFLVFSGFCGKLGISKLQFFMIKVRETVGCGIGLSRFSFFRVLLPPSPLLTSTHIDAHLYVTGYRKLPFEENVDDM